MKDGSSKNRTFGTLPRAEPTAKEILDLPPEALHNGDDVRAARPFHIPQRCIAGRYVWNPLIAGQKEWAPCSVF